MKHVPFIVVTSVGGGEEDQGRSSRASMTRRRPSEISRDWRGEIAGQIGWAPGITVMRFSSDRFRVRGMERGEKWFSETEDGG